MSKLQNDEVSVKLNLQAQEAQENIHKLSKEIENLRKQNMETVRKSRVSSDG